MLSTMAAKFQTYLILTIDTVNRNPPDCSTPYYYLLDKYKISVKDLSVILTDFCMDWRQPCQSHGVCDSPEASCTECLHELLTSEGSTSHLN